jgi:hypothetical protein
MLFLHFADIYIPFFKLYYQIIIIVIRCLFQLVMEAIMGRSDTGDIAIDDVYMYNGKCIV